MGNENLDRLRDEADILSVIDYLGIEVKQKGTTYFIPCPRPEHNDEHVTNCYCKSGDNFVYCTVCGERINAIDILMYHGQSFADACETLWNIEGCPSWFQSFFEKKETKRTLNVSRKDMEFLGIKLPGRILKPVRIDAKKKREKGYAYHPKTLEYLKCEIEKVTWRDLMTEPEMARFIIQKAKMREEAIRDYAKRFPDDREIKKEAEKMCIRCKDIIKRTQPFAKTA